MSPSFSNLLKHWDFVIIDLFCLVVAFVLAYCFKFGDFNLFFEGSWRSLLMFFLLADLLFTLAMAPYSGILRRGYWADIASVLKLALFVFGTAFVLFYLLKIGEDYSREMMGMTIIIYTISAFALKAARKHFILTHTDVTVSAELHRIVIVTTSDSMIESDKLASANDIRTGIVVAYCLTDAEASSEFDDKPVVPITDLCGIAAHLIADEVLVTVDPAEIGARRLESLIEDGVRVSFALEDSLGVISEYQTLGHVGAYRTLSLDRYTFGSTQLLYLPIKRALDIVLGIVGCIVTLPIIGVVKMAYLASGDRHSIVYRQKRIGYHGRPFGMLKLRTMVWNAEEELVQMLKEPALRAEWERSQKFEDDPRITPIGRVLRRTSLDELPQFLNVLMGEMSVVGPRPLVPGELEEHGGRSLYNKVKPGITGWWSCNGRSNIEYRERLELEYHYVRHCSLYLDLLCIMRTFIAVIKRNGAR